jgi:hypothetical protein
MPAWDQGAADALEKFVRYDPDARPKKKRLSLSRRRILGHVQEVNDRLQAKNWEGYTPTLLVALFMWCHEKTYNTEPLELLSPKTFTRARMQAARLRDKEFGGNMDDTLEFMRWTWRKEQATEEWRRTKNNGQGRTIDWYRQFCSSELVTKYRIDRARRAGHG